MSDRTRGSRLRRGVIVALSAAAALALAPAAYASNAINYTPTNGADLQNYIANTVDPNPGAGFYIVHLKSATTYTLSSPITISSGVNIEITGDPQNQAASSSQADIINAIGIPQKTDSITVASGANALFKAITLLHGSPQGLPYAALRIDGHAEIDNSAIGASSGTNVGVTSGVTQAQVVINNSYIGDSSNSGLIADNSSSVILNNDTVAYNNHGGLQGKVTLNNTLVAINDPLGGPTSTNPDCFETAGQVTATSSYDDDGSCAAAAGGTGHGVSTDSTRGDFDLSDGAFGTGGPVESPAIDQGSTAYGAGSGCSPSDIRFFVTPNVSTDCSVGAYQPDGAQDTVAPSCPAPGTSPVIHEATSSTDTSTETVQVSDSGAGLGPDAVTASTLTSTYPSGNGTVAWPTLSGSPFDASGTPLASPEPAFPSSTGDAASNGNYPVTASKATGDQKAGDTSWSFPLMSWSGITITCK